jgi:putative flippase GtrA
MNINEQLVRFLAAGMFVGATDFGIYYALIHSLSFSFAKVISFICAGIVAYFINKHWTFQSRHPSWAEFLRYIFINALAMLINVLSNKYLLWLWPGAVLPALAAASMLTGGFTFICFKWWVFDAHPPARQTKE